MIYAAYIEKPETIEGEPFICRSLTVDRWPSLRSKVAKTCVVEPFLCEEFVKKFK